MYLNVLLSHLQQVDQKINALFPEFRYRAYFVINQKFLQRIKHLHSSHLEMTNTDRNLQSKLHYFEVVQQVQTNLEIIYANLHNNINLMVEPDRFQTLWVTIGSKIQELKIFLDAIITSLKTSLEKSHESIIKYQNKSLKHNDLSELYFNLCELNQFLASTNLAMTILKETTI